MLLRKVIYMGECGEGAVYFDTVKQMALVAPKSQLLNTYVTGKTNRFIPVLIILFIFGGTGFMFANPFGGYYSKETLVFLMIIWLMEFLGLICLLERVLYKNLKDAVPTSRENFRHAVYGNLFWNNFSEKRVTRGKKIWAWVLTLIMFLCAFSPLLMIKMGQTMLGRVIGNEIIMVSLVGIMPAIAFIMIWQNNIIRWMNVVEKYQKRQIKWGQETK